MSMFFKVRVTKWALGKIAHATLADWQTVVIILLPMWLAVQLQDFVSPPTRAETVQMQPWEMAKQERINHARDLATKRFFAD